MLGANQNAPKHDSLGERSDDGRTNGRTVGRSDGRTDGRTDERTVGRTVGRTGGRSDGDGRTEECTVGQTVGRSNGLGRFVRMRSCLWTENMFNGNSLYVEQKPLSPVLVEHVATFIPSIVRFVSVYRCVYMYIYIYLYVYMSGGQILCSWSTFEDDSRQSYWVILSSPWFH